MQFKSFHWLSPQNKSSYTVRVLYKYDKRARDFFGGVILSLHQFSFLRVGGVFN